MDSILLDSLSMGVHCFLVTPWLKLSKLMTTRCSGCLLGGRVDYELRLCTRWFFTRGGSALPYVTKVRCWMKRLRRWLAAFSLTFRSFYEGRVPRGPSYIDGFSKLIEKIGWFCDYVVTLFIAGPSSIPSLSTVAIRLRLNLYLAGRVIFLLLFWSTLAFFRSPSSSQLASLALRRRSYLWPMLPPTKRCRNSWVSRSLSSSSTREAFRSSRRCSLGLANLE